MKFAQRVFWWSGIAGIIVLAPMYFLEERIGRDYPPAITHPEHFYGFLGVALACQVMFLVIARDPQRFRPMMIPAMLEKFSYSAAVVVLYLQGRVAVPVLASGLFDLTLGVLFIVAYSWTPAGEARAGVRAA